MPLKGQFVLSRVQARISGDIPVRACIGGEIYLGNESQWSISCVLPK